MKLLLILLLIGGAGYLCYDDYSNRNELENAKKQIQLLTQERDQAMRKLYPHGAPSAHASATPPPAWFQKRIQQKSLLGAPQTNK